MFKNFLESAKKLKETRVISACAVLIALYVVLYAYPIKLAPELRITFTFIPLALSGWLFGCVPAMLVGGISDIISALLFPQGAYFPGFTLTAILSGLIFGLFLYKKEKVLLGVIVSRTLINLLLNIALNSLWLSILYEKGFIVYLASHFFKNIVLLPIEIILLVMVIKFITRHGIKKMYK